MDMGILEACAILAALSAGLGGPIAVLRWVGGAIDRKVEESEKATRGLINTHAHGLANVKSRVDQIERLRTCDIERIVKLETNLTNLEKGQERIEHTLEKMDGEQKDARAEIIESLRELRNVTPKG